MWVLVPTPQEPPWSLCKPEEGGPGPGPPCTPSATSCRVCADSSVRDLGIVLAPRFLESFLLWKTPSACRNPGRVVGLPSTRPRRHCVIPDLSPLSSELGFVFLSSWDPLKGTQRAALAAAPHLMLWLPCRVKAPSQGHNLDLQVRVQPSAALMFAWTTSSSGCKRALLVWPVCLRSLAGLPERTLPRSPRGRQSRTVPAPRPALRRRAWHPGNGQWWWREWGEAFFFFFCNELLDL